MISIILVSFLEKVRKLRHSPSQRFRNLAKTGWCLLFPRHVMESDNNRGQRTRKRRARPNVGSADWSVLLTHLPHRNGVSRVRQREHRDHGISM
jgi:hypothetical protein